MLLTNLRLRLHELVLQLGDVIHLNDDRVSRDRRSQPSVTVSCDPYHIITSSLDEDLNGFDDLENTKTVSVSPVISQMGLYVHRICAVSAETRPRSRDHGC